LPSLCDWLSLWLDVGEGQRVRKWTYDANGILQDTTMFVYSAGKLVAEYSTAPRFWILDFGFWILDCHQPQPFRNHPTVNPKSEIQNPKLKGSQGNVIARRDFKPFGEEITNNTGERTIASKYGVADNLKQKFTTYQRDEESGLDFAEARMYENRHGRFTAVDPLLASGKSANP
jgi:RHS repeat-associated protein